MEQRISELNQVLLERGVRLTPQRLMVLEALAEHAGGHITADRVLTAVVQRYPYVDKTTVYRTLELLREHGLVVMTDLGGGKFEYELVGQPHHHIVCKTCGYTVALDDATLDPLRALVEAQTGFQPCFDHFALFGVCPACQASAVPAVWPGNA
jgi:Fur family ferric uptake transcriptional regulator